MTENKPRPTYREIMEQAALDTLNTDLIPALCYSASVLMVFVLAIYGAYRVAAG